MKLLRAVGAPVKESSFSLMARGTKRAPRAASSPEVANVTGKYFYKYRPTNPSAPALDDRAALALWQRSAALAGMEE